MVKSNIIFDLDGTLWDSTQTVFIAWEKVLANAGLKVNLTKSDFNNLMGKTNKEIELFLKETYNIDMQNFLRPCQMQEIEELKLIPTNCIF